MPIASPSGSTPFVGREVEFAELTGRLDALLAGHGGLVLVAGEPGIGKTRLADELAHVTRQRGARVLWGRCFEGEGAPAFWPWVQVIRSAVRATAPERLRGDLGVGAAAIAQIVPELRDVLPDLPEAPIAPDPDQARFSLFDAITSFLIHVTTAAPLVLLLDDLHWADVPSLLLLEFLVAELEDTPLLILGLYRDVEVARGHPLNRTLGALARWPQVGRLTLAGLGAREVAQIIQGIVGTAPPADLVTTVLDRTEGNPLFVNEFGRLLASEGYLTRPSPAAWQIRVPQTTREVIGRRLLRLSTECNRLLTVAAVVGREFSSRLIGQAAGLAGAALLTVLEEAEAARVIEPTSGAGDVYRFTHALIRETLYEDLPVAGRARLHQQVGRALEVLGGPNRDSLLPELAHHFVHAAVGGDVAKAVTYARRAGDLALARLGYEEAAHQYEAALRTAASDPATDDATRCNLLLSQGTALTHAGDLEGGKRAFLEAATLARSLGSGERLARAALGYGGWEDVPFPDEARTQLLEDALRALAEDERGPRAEVLARLARVHYWSGRHDEAMQLSAEAVTLARRAGELQALLPILSTRHNVLGAPEHLAERLVLATEMRRLARDADAPRWIMSASGWLAIDLLEAGDIVAADEELAGYERLADRLRQPYFQWWAAVTRAMRALLEGHFEEGKRRARDAYERGRRMRPVEALSAYAEQRFVVLCEEGRLGEAIASIKDNAARWPALAGFRSGLTYAYTEEGHTAEARAELEHLLRDDGAHLPRDGYLPQILAQLAHVCVTLNDAERAAVVYRLLLPFADRVVVTPFGASSWGAASRPLGMLAAVVGDWEAAEHHFEAALALNTRLGARPWVAHTQVAYGAMLLLRCRAACDAAGAACDHAARARTLLDGALATTRALGMTRLTGQVEKLRYRIGGGQRSAARGGQFPNHLSPREVEVLQLLAAGRSNQEIAAALVLSIRTVERHIEAIYAKLGAHGKAARAFAAAFALRHDLTAS